MLSKEKLIDEVNTEIDYWQGLVDRINENTRPEEADRRNGQYEFWVTNLYYLTKEK